MKKVKLTIMSPKMNTQVRELKYLTVFQRGSMGTVSLKVERGSVTLNHGHYISDSDRGTDLVGVIHGELTLEVN